MEFLGEVSSSHIPTSVFLPAKSCIHQPTHAGTFAYWLIIVRPPSGHIIILSPFLNVRFFELRANDLIQEWDISNI
jgi:hypothetical protein